jgi:hypothetical protein
MLAEVEMSAQNAAHAARFVPGWDLSVWGSFVNGHTLNPQGHPSAASGIDGSDWPLAGRRTDGPDTLKGRESLLAE